MKYSRIISAFYDSPWAILPAKLQAMEEFVRQKSADISISHEQLQNWRVVNDATSETRYHEIAVAARGKFPKAAGRVAVLPIRGVMAQRMNMLQDFSGGSSTEKIGKQYDASIDDDSVGAVLLDIDTPGGSVYGVQELADKIREGAIRKPVYAISNALCASAGYWVATAVGKGNFCMTPSGEVGSIGVLAYHVDFSAQNEMIGIAPTYIYAGKYKIEGNADEPLNDEAVVAIQKSVDEYYASFAGAVAKGREVRESAVRNGFGQGRVLGAKAAIEEGMVDRIVPFDLMLAELTGGKRAAIDVPVKEASTEAERMAWRMKQKGILRGSVFSN